MTTSTATTAAVASEPEAAQAAEPAQNTEAAQYVPDSPPVPIPVLAPYLGLVAAVLSALGGGWLLLAPYALDFRHGARQLPRAATADLETGAAVIAVGVVAAVLFSMNLLLRLRGEDPAAAPAAEYGPEPEPEESPEAEEIDVAVTEPARPKEVDPGGALRELLTPLVAALAADLRSHDHEQAQRKGP